MQALSAAMQLLAGSRVRDRATATVLGPGMKGWGPGPAGLASRYTAVARLQDKYCYTCITSVLL